MIAAPAKPARRKAAEPTAQRPAKPPTLATIAREVGVSRMTVSYALRGDGSADRLAAETVRRVRAAARRLNYVPNDLARQLRRTRTGVVGVIVPDLKRDWADRVLAGMQPVFDEADCLPLLMTHRWDAQRAAADVASLVRRRVDGLIVFPVEGLLRRIADVVPEATPMVLLGDTDDAGSDAGSDEGGGLSGRVRRVIWDAGPAAAAAAGHLLDVGCRRPAFVGADPHSPMARTRIDGFASALRGRGLAPDDWHVLWDDHFDTDALADRLLALLAEPGAGGRVDGVLAMNDSIAADLLVRLHAAGYRPPRDLKLAGMGDLPIAGDAAIGLTTVGEPCEALGRQAALRVLAMADGDDGGAGGAGGLTLVPGSELHVRRTTRDDSQ